jgi:hypothetical protein
MPERSFRHVRTERAISGPLSMKTSGGQLIRDIEPARLMPILFTIVTLVYVILVGAFFVYESQKKENALLVRRTIDACLSSGGRIGPGHTCWYAQPAVTQYESFREDE